MVAPLTKRYACVPPLSDSLNLPESFTKAGQSWFFIPFLLFPRSEEKCLVRSGLVQLMDRLCSLSSQTESSSSEKQTKKQKVATMAWAAFQVLANRCVEWEKEEGEQWDSTLPVGGRGEGSIELLIRWHQNYTETLS